MPYGEKSRDTIAKKAGISHETVRMYIRLTNLIPELLEMVDNGVIKDKNALQIALKPAVEISYLSEECQRNLADEIDLNDCTPSHAQTIRMRKLFEKGKLTPEAISAIMSEEKSNQKERVKIPVERIRKYFPKDYTTTQMEEIIVKLCEAYHRKRLRDRDSR